MQIPRGISGEAGISKLAVCLPPPLSTPMNAGPLLAAAAPPSFPPRPSPTTNLPNCPLATKPLMTGALLPPRPMDGAPRRPHHHHLCLLWSNHVLTTKPPSTGWPATMTTATPTTRARTTTTILAQAAAAAERQTATVCSRTQMNYSK